MWSSNKNPEWTPRLRKRDFISTLREQNTTPPAPENGKRVLRTNIHPRTTTICRHIGSARCGGEFSTTLGSSLLERRVCVNLFLPCLPARQRQVQAEGHVLSLLLAVVLFVGVSAGNTRSVADKRIVRIENNENALSVSNASLHRF